MSVRRKNFNKSKACLLMALPAMICMLVFTYLPMLGNVVAFKSYRYSDGIFGGDWVGLENFKAFLSTSDFVRVLRNTILYQLANLILVGLFFGMFWAILLYEVKSRRLNKIYQTTMLAPFFLSWVVVSAIVLMLLNPANGVVNSILEALGMQGINWYSEPKYWPVILMIALIWKDGGYASLYFYAALLNIDAELFEAAKIDGAGKLQQIWYVTVPCLKSMACLTIITRLGGILGAQLDLFYQLPMNSGPLYPATDVLSTYLQRSLQGGNLAQTTAVGLFQSVVGLVLVLISNAIIKKIDPESAMF